MTEASRPAAAWLTLGMADGKERRIDLAPAGDGVRLAIGTPSERASVWRMTSPRSKRGWSDVYIAAGALGTTQKFSLHESGVWRNAWHSDDLAEHHGFTPRIELGRDPRLLDRWQRPEGQSGWTRALSVWVPYGHLSPVHEPENPRKPIQFVPPPEPGELVGLHFMIVTPDLGQLKLRGIEPAAGFVLPNNDAAIVMVSRASVDEPTVREHEQVAHPLLLNSIGAPPYPQEIRMGVFGHDDSGYRFVWDLSVQAIMRHTEPDSGVTPPG